MSNTLAVDKIDAIGLDAIIDMIYDGNMLSDIARKIGVSKSSLNEWYSQGERLARINAARIAAAERWDELAVQVLTEAPSDKNEIARARELAQHYRWRASKLSPKLYGDRLTTEHTGTPAVAIQIITGVPSPEPRTIDATAAPVIDTGI